MKIKKENKMKKIQRSYIREILDSIKDETISFAGGLPNEELFPMAELSKATNKILRNSKCMQYSKSQGLDELREHIANIYNDELGFTTTKDDILITTGSQQAFDIISKTFIQDEVFVQTPTYIGALSAFKVLDLKIKGFNSNSCLNRELKKSSVVYMMSDFQNPTGETIDETNREIIAHILQKNGSYLIEDGAYSLLDFEGEIKKPISLMYENSFHLGSFSKIVAPGLRVGWIRAKKELIEQILASKEALDLHTPTFNQMILNEYLNENNLFEHIKEVRADYKTKMLYMAEAFRKYLPSFEFEIPKGGMFIYGKFDCDSFEFAKKALENNIAFVPAKVFYHDNQDSCEARFNFTNSSFEQINSGVLQIAKLLDYKEMEAG